MRQGLGTANKQLRARFHVRNRPCAGSNEDSRQNLGTIHSTKMSGNFGPKLNGSVLSNRKSFEKRGPPFEVDHFSRSDRLEFWLNGLSRPRLKTAKNRREKSPRISSLLELSLFHHINVDKIMLKCNSGN